MVGRLETDEAAPAFSARQFVLLTFWIVVRLVLVFYLGQTGTLFFYQNFSVRQGAAGRFGLMFSFARLQGHAAACCCVFVGLCLASIGIRPFTTGSAWLLQTDSAMDMSAFDKVGRSISGVLAERRRNSRCLRAVGRDAGLRPCARGSTRCCCARNVAVRLAGCRLPLKTRT